MRIKKGVKVEGVQSVTVIGMLIAESVHDSIMKKEEEMVITSVNDGVHMKNSRHYKGLAFDVRTRYMTENEINRFVNNLKDAMSENYDIVREKTHIHIEYEPK